MLICLYIWLSHIHKLLVFLSIKIFQRIGDNLAAFFVNSYCFRRFINILTLLKINDLYVQSYIF